MAYDSLDYVVDVEVSTHEALKLGVLATRFSRVRLAADAVATDAEAMVLAAQLAACTSDAMPTRTTLVSFPI